MVDDALLYNDSMKANFRHTFDYLKLCRDNGIMFSCEKLQFCEIEVEFAGFRVTADGVKPSRQILATLPTFQN